MIVSCTTHDGDQRRRAYIDTSKVEAVYEADHGRVCICLNRVTFLVDGTLDEVASWLGMR